MDEIRKFKVGDLVWIGPDCKDTPPHQGVHVVLKVYNTLSSIAKDVGFFHPYMLIGPNCPKEECQETGIGWPFGDDELVLVETNDR